MLNVVFGGEEGEDDAEDENAEEDENGGENRPDNLVHDFAPLRLRFFQSNALTDGFVFFQESLAAVADV
jgi:hypothetical protein